MTDRRLQAQTTAHRRRWLRGYLWLLMAGLFVQGIGAIAITGLHFPPPANPLLAELLSSNPPHAAVHIVWGAGGLALLLTQREANPAWWLATSFGVFYTLLGFLGVAVHNPLGMQLGVAENSFHLFIGPLTIIVAILTRGVLQHTFVPRTEPL